MRILLLLLVPLALPFAAAAQKTPAAKPAGKPAQFNPNAVATKVPPKPKPAATAAPDTSADDVLVRKAAELPLVLKGSRREGDYVYIDYSTPYTGMVELRLFEGERQVYQDQYVNGIGDNGIRLKATAFKPGKAYRYTLTFKGKETKGSLTL